jgi:hypothetical protein
MTPPDLTRDLDDDHPQDWRDLAEAAIMDLRRYANDETPERRLVSADTWEDRFALLDSRSLSEPAAPAGAIEDIARERQRQISFEGWTPEHDDDQHDKGEMARAAACYAYEATRTEHQRSLDDGFAPPMWPWAERWWKPTDSRRDLVKAGALIVAEIERLDRALATPQPVEPPDDTLNDIAAGNEALAWIDMRNEPAADWTKRVIATNPEYVAANGAENFLPLGILVASKR